MVRYAEDVSPNGEVQPEPITLDNIGAVHWRRMRDEILYSSGRWFKCCRFFELICTPRNARMLDFLVNWQRTRGKGQQWFFCLTDSITREAFIPPASQPAIFRSLREVGYIKTEMRGRSAKRWIRINYRKICRDLHAAYAEWDKKYRGAEG